MFLNLGGMKEAKINAWFEIHRRFLQFENQRLIVLGGFQEIIIHLFPFEKGEFSPGLGADTMWQLRYTCTYSAEFLLFH